MKLQVALDLVDIEVAASMAKSLYTAGAVDVLEAGTPLIKSSGMYSVARLRSCCRNATIFADLKTMDAGAIEVRMAGEAGADMASVLAVAPLETIVDFTKTAASIGIKSVVDFIGVTDVEGRLREILAAGARPDYVGLHVGIDVQKSTGLTAANLIDKAVQIKQKHGIQVTIAGGIDERIAKSLAGRDIDIVVVGGAITGADDPLASASRIRRSLGI
ncbi:orotidine 5'-phosphate decarboxylase [Thermocladium modestius]|uniref:Orotidine 5'-phosphate decarboxylase n=1 Tax=Thermocladium modestius TaxID=62609 RepID=A0A830H0N9_9CREN|nr:orotidine 5'-phosphate decarboxylase / HUMPS family protein [Thermocladium modestius]GGP22324.1 orotidine 5'-phosphate decarboxylase [Thermocladium modestius]